MIRERAYDGRRVVATRKSKASRRGARRLRRLLQRETELWAEGRQRVAGLDEAGMGPLAGPVVAAAVIFRPGHGLRGVDDSKRLSDKSRRELDVQIRAEAEAFSVVAVEVEEIDALNIYRAGIEAMRRAVERLAVPPDFLLVDARRVSGLDIAQEAVVRGDARCHAIAAASILAKTLRDDLMAAYDARYPGYDFAAHKGYATAAHRDALRRLGPSPIHRRSFTLLPHPRLFD
jgi:ribonuclease HII